VAFLEDFDHRFLIDQLPFQIGHIFRHDGRMLFQLKSRDWLWIKLIFRALSALLLLLSHGVDVFLDFALDFRIIWRLEYKRVVASRQEFLAMGRSH
jgi:hypothetical protein